MNTLTFRCTPNTDAGEKNTVHVEMLLDGSSPYGGLLDVAGILFGGAAERCSYYLYTCSCGVAGCEGFHTPLEQTRKGNIVTWFIEDEKLSDLLGAKELTFDMEDFDAARASLFADLKEFEKTSLYAESLMDTDWTETNEEVRVGIKLEPLAARLSPYYHGQTAMNKAIDNATDPFNPGNLRISWGLAPRLDDAEPAVENFYPIDAVHAALQLLNAGESVTPDNAVRVALLPAVSNIIRAFVDTGDAQAAEEAFRPFRVFLEEDHLDDPDTPYFHTDADGPFVRFP